MSRGQDFDFIPVDEPTPTPTPNTSLSSEQPVFEAVIAAITNYTNAAAEDEEIAISDLSDGQEKILSMFLVCSAILSLIGSCTIVFKILRSLCRNQTTTPYDRIILGLSCCDIVASCTYALGPFLLPSETSQRVWAIGDDASCQKLGFLMQLSTLWAVWYNAILSFYYLLTVRFQVKRKAFCRKYELWMHLPGAIFFPTTAVMGYIGGWYAEEELAMTCWIGDIKTGCDDSGNCSGDWGELIAYTFGALPTIITLLSVVINNIVIIVYVRKSLIAGNNATPGTENNETERQEIQTRLSKEAAMQGFLYVTTFLITILPAFTIQILDGSFGYDESDQGRVYPLLVLNSILLPLQGFFNVFIYVRPSYSRFSTANPEKSTWFILKQALFDPNIPRMSSYPGATSEPISAALKELSKTNKKCGSNFSISLGNIVEEVNEDDSVDGGADNNPDSTADSMSAEISPAQDSRMST